MKNTNTKKLALTSEAESNELMPVDVISIHETQPFAAEHFSEEEYAAKTPDEIRSCFDSAYNAARQIFMQIAFLLAFIKKKKLFNDPAFGCYPSIEAFAEAEYKIRKTQTYNYIKVWEKFGDQERPMLCQEEYKDYTMTQLLVIKDLNEDDKKIISPDMSVREMKELLPKKKAGGGKARHIPSTASFQEKLGQAEREHVRVSETGLTLEELTKLLNAREFIMDDNTSIDSFVFDITIRYVGTNNCSELEAV